ncbi:MAG: DNA alkylation repair protein [Lachnospiraceae bacterium]|nr:DNA alkylation repair protein [Lachnospiraceae bacterium]
MNNQEIKDFLFANAELEFRKFTSALIPGTTNILGVRIPKLRALAKQIAKGDFRTYLQFATDDSYEEIMLQGFVIGYAKADIDEILQYVERFVPKIRDWSVNDGFCATLKITDKHRENVWDFLMRYKDSTQEFEQRFLAVMLMNYFLTEEYIDKVLEIWDNLQHEGYYRQMGVAWGIATAYAKFPQKTYQFLLKNHLDDFTYNKAIQKMIESYRISAEDKVMLRAMKRV